MTVFSPGTGIPLHSHNVEESVLVFEGEATAVVGDDEFDLVAGQATWVPAGVPHCFRNRGEGSMTIYWVYGGRDVTRTITATGETFEHLSDERPRSCAVRRAPGMSAVVTVNPATGERLAEYPAFSDAEVDAALDRAAAAQAGWAALPYAERAAVLRRAAEVLRAEAEDLALLVTREMGKPLAEARAEVEKCATACDYYAEHAGDFLADEPVATSADRSWIGYEPVGVVLAVMPWNFPLWQVLRFAAPALMAGNAALLKHSPNTTGCALAVERVLADAGAPAGLFAALVVAEPDVPAVTRRLIDDPRIGAVTITGSERAGRAVGSAAGDAIKKSVLELGGSDPFVVLADADLPRVAAMAARGRFLNAGQSCISPKRFVVDASVVEEFTRLLVAEVSALTVGDPEATAPTSGRWPGRTCSRASTGRSRPRSRRAPGCWPAGSGSSGRATSTRRRCWPTSRPVRSPTTRRSSARWPR